MKSTLLLLTTLVTASAVRGHAPTSTSALAAPGIIMFHGGILEGRRYMTTFEANMTFMGAIAQSAPIPRDAVAGRPSIEVALYWHIPTWERHATDTALLKTLRPESGQPARFYLGEGHHPPVFDYYSAGANAGLRTVTSTGVEILKRHDVPVHVDRQGN